MFSTMNNGRVAMLRPQHPHANNRGYVLLSRIIMEEHLGRLLKSSEEVHHIDGNITNDKLENLVIKTKGEHTKLHGIDRRQLDYELIYKLYDAGNGYKSIAKITGYNRSSVRYAILVRGRSVSTG